MPVPMMPAANTAKVSNPAHAAPRRPVRRSGCRLRHSRSVSPRLALPALAGSAAYAWGEILSWHVGLARLPRRAKAFYATITVGMALGVALNFSAIDPIWAPYWSAVLNGVVAVPVIVMMMRLTTRPSVMAGFTLPLPLQVMGGLATATMTATVVAHARDQATARMAAG